jgi:hypothetical protein
MTQRDRDRDSRDQSGETSPPIDEEALRHPLETRIFVLSVVLNVSLLILAIVLATNAAEWVEAHPVIARTVKHISALATGLVLAPFALTFVRNARRSYVRGNSVELSREQMPELHGMLERHCARIGLDPLPGLFLSQTGISEFSTAFTARGKHFIVLGTRFAEPNFARVREVLNFTIARELGRIRLGHTKWHNELLVAYVMRIPILREPLEKVRVLSLDRYAAKLVPDGLPGLLVLGSGRLLLRNVNVADYLAQVDAYSGIWRWIANIGKPDVPALLRIRILYAAGFFDREVDLQTFTNGLPVNGWQLDAPPANLPFIAPAATAASTLTSD